MMMDFRKATAACLLVAAVIFLGVMAPGRAFAADKDKGGEAVVSVQPQPNDEKPLAKKPLVVLEWERVWGDLWVNEAADLQKRGLTNEQIVQKLNPVALERVSKNLNLYKEPIMKVVDAYYEAEKKKASGGK
jgi:hypothetical protein